MSKPASKVVHLHVGAPKTGTTYLQDRLMLNRASLADHGVTIPVKNRFIDADLFHFRAALDLLDQDWGGGAGHAEGAWADMVRRVRRAPGTSIISHEILAPAEPDKITRALNDLGGPGGAEVHVVYSARDLGRQLPAAWQESIKQGRKWTFKRFLTRVEHGETWFRRAMDLPVVLANWSAKVPPERIHVVTVPHHRGPEGQLLWQRFCGAFGIDPAWTPLDSERANRSLGIDETQLIRQLNRRLGHTGRREATYDALIRELLAQRELVSRRSRPVTLPPDRYDWVEAQAQGWIDWISESGVHVVGDVEDLRPLRPGAETIWHDPDRVRTKPQLSAALDALTVMTREAAARPDPERQLGNRLRANLQKLRGT